MIWGYYHFRKPPNLAWWHSYSMDGPDPWRKISNEVRCLWENSSDAHLHALHAFHQSCGASKGGVTSNRNHGDGDRKSPIPGIVGPVPNGLYKWLIKGGYYLPTYKSWDDPPSTEIFGTRGVWRGVFSPHDQWVSEWSDISFENLFLWRKLG